ncbi:disease resistance protein TAO1-like [Pyrus x bretschneideri]|uniref:disease resistance protein TAO1-like n=1 Tax=Pyrus x bretschneideri TaxID=225117 RepID=UPI00202E1667|nr:disease resistance protein TAO1-like [Pyrus x bretschneideri]
MMIGDEDILAPAETTSSACTCCSLFSIFSPLVSGASGPHVSASSSSPLSKLISLEIIGIEDRECVPERWLRNLTSLKNLSLSRCRRLRCIPLSPSPSVQHLTTLDFLEIVRCNELDLWKEDESFSQWKSLRSLRTLRISECDRLIKLPQGIGNLTSLSKLVIGNCRNLASLPVGMCRLTTLDCLEIMCCNELDLWKEDESFSQWKSLRSLRTLRISECDRLIKLPEGIGNLTSLSELVIEYCPNLASLPEGMCRLTSLETLRIYNCSSVLRQRCEKERGEDWSKIAHIPNINFSDIW